MRSNVTSLNDFRCVELCNLCYEPDRGAAIDPHKDDEWLWGERLVTLNLLSDTAYCMLHESAATDTSEQQQVQKTVSSNEQSSPLPCFSSPISCIDIQASSFSSKTDLKSFSSVKSPIITVSESQLSDVMIRIPLPRRSLVIIAGDARYTWLHSIRSEDIQSRRIGITFRELSSEFMEGGSRANEGQSLLATAETFKGVSVLESRTCKR